MVALFVYIVQIVRLCCVIIIPLCVMMQIPKKDQNHNQEKRILDECVKTIFLLTIKGLSLDANWGFTKF